MITKKEKKRKEKKRKDHKDFFMPTYFFNFERGLRRQRYAYTTSD